MRIRGEKNPRRINYADYAKLLTFYTGQARLIKDRKHIMVALSDGALINTADITSLESGESEVFIEKKPTVPENIANLPTKWCTFQDPNDPEITCEALCHYGADKDGVAKTYQSRSEIKELRKFRKTSTEDRYSAKFTSTGSRNSKNTQYFALRGRRTRETPKKAQ